MHDGAAASLLDVVVLEPDTKPRGVLAAACGLASRLPGTCSCEGFRVGGMLVAPAHAASIVPAARLLSADMSTVHALV
jgi:hypothetical protein